jgi:hypothetical protein
MAKVSIGGVRAMGLGPGFKYMARVVLLTGVLLMVVGLFAESASATSPAAGRREPTLTPYRASFNIPKKNPPNREFGLSLWNIVSPTKQHLLGRDTGTSGKLIVKVPPTPGCDFQVDVYARQGKAQPKFYSGFKQQLTNCGRTVVTTTTTSGGGTTTTTKPGGGTTTTTGAGGTTTTTKPKTTGSTGGSTTGSTGGSTTGSSGSSTGGSGSATTQPATTVPSSQLAFTGAGLGMWLTAAIGALLILAGGLMLLYASRYSAL